MALSSPPAHNPWLHEDFHGDDYYGWILTLPPSTLRTASITEGLFPEEAGYLKTRELVQLEAQSPSKHNDELLAYIRPGGAATFVKFLDVLAKMDYDLQVERFSRLITPTAQPAAEPGLPATLTPSSEPFADVTNSENLLSNISDLEAFGAAVRDILGGPQQDALAKELVKRKGGFVNNYRTIVKNWIELHDKGTAELSNVSGQLFYFVEKKEMSCGEFLLMLQSLFSLAVARQVAGIVAKTEFL